MLTVVEYRHDPPVRPRGVEHAKFYPPLFLVRLNLCSSLPPISLSHLKLPCSSTSAPPSSLLPSRSLYRNPSLPILLRKVSRGPPFLRGRWTSSVQLKSPSLVSLPGSPFISFGSGVITTLHSEAPSSSYTDLTSCKSHLHPFPFVEEQKEGTISRAHPTRLTELNPCLLPGLDHCLSFAIDGVTTVAAFSDEESSGGLQCACLTDEEGQQINYDVGNDAEGLRHVRFVRPEFSSL